MEDLTRADVDAWEGVAVLEFGASWCPNCQRARPIVDRALADYPGLRHVWIEDARGEPLGRSFGVKLWPTLILLRDGKEIARLVRPRRDADVHHALAALDVVARRAAR